MPSFKDRLKAFLDADKEEEEEEVEEVVEVGLDDDDEADDEVTAGLKAKIEEVKAELKEQSRKKDLRFLSELEELQAKALKIQAENGTEPPAVKSTATKPVKAGASSKKVDVGSMTMEERAKYGTDIMAPADKAGKSLI